MATSSVPRARVAALTLATMTVLALANPAVAQTLFVQDFSAFDLEAPPEGQIVSMGVIDGGEVDFVDDTTTTRSFFLRHQELTAPTMTLSFDVTEPVVNAEGGATMELLIRVGIGTGNNSLQSGDAIAEAIVFRMAPRGAYLNNGNETIFMVMNNKPGDLVFPSPVDGVDVTLPEFNYITYSRDNTTDVFGIVKGVSAYVDRNGADAGFGGLLRTSIGSSSSGNLGTFSLDNVLFEEGVSFERLGLDVGQPGDVDGDDDVDLADFAAIQNHFQQSVTLRADGDLNGDGFVDFVDFRQWKDNFTPPVGAAGAAVPEPSSLAIAAAALCALFANRRRSLSK
jgi:hypothetical protein